MRTYTFGTTPPEVIAEAAPGTFHMALNATDARTVAGASPRSAIALIDGRGNLSPEQLAVLLADLLEADDEDAWSLRTSILIMLDIEEV